MRELGKFLIEIKTLEKSVSCISDCIDPTKFNSVAAAVRNASGFNEETAKYGVHSLALKLGYSLNMCANIIRPNALKECNYERVKQAEGFVDLYKSDWSYEISSCALKTLHDDKYNKVKRIPLAKDLKKLHDCLNVKVHTAKEELITHPSPESWRDLAEGTLAQVSLFNKRRGGEMQRMELQQYQEGMSGKGNQEEVLKTLTPFEKKIADQLHRVEICGKRGRRVPVLLTQSHKESIDLLIDFREVSGISQENKFVFAFLSGTLRTSDVLRKYARDCGAARPDLLTTTSLRKHIGTICQLLNLKDNELDALASFMGHDIRVHRNFYRLPEDTYQVAKVSKVLLQLEKGNISSCSGKNLDDITMDEDEEVEFENSDEEENTKPKNQSVKASSDLDLPVTDSQRTEGSKNLPLEAEDTLMSSVNSPSNCSKTEAAKKKNPRGAVVKRPWSDEEVDAVKRCLGKYFRIPQLPGKAECTDTLKQEPVLHNRTWKQIKFFIKNRKSSLRHSFCSK